MNSKVAIFIKKLTDVPFKYKVIIELLIFGIILVLTISFSILHISKNDTIADSLNRMDAKFKEREKALKITLDSDIYFLNSLVNTKLFQNSLLNYNDDKVKEIFKNRLNSKKIYCVCV
ncbi:MAG: hypothetical protein U9N02_04825 [Campylobacterota bacterium]|nr:hypothetical protein [Campylobacterota bacterium]